MTLEPVVVFVLVIGMAKFCQWALFDNDCPHYWLLTLLKDPLMETFKRKGDQSPVIVREVTDSLFEDPHPNPAHVAGWIYNPNYRTVTVPTAVGSKLTANVGDRIVVYADEGIEIFTAEQFSEKFEAVEPESPAEPVQDLEIPFAPPVTEPT